MVLIVLVLLAVVLTYGENPMIPADRHARFLIGSIGILAIIGAAYNGGLAVAFRLGERKRNLPR
jgi:hypothetical protein